MELDTSTLMMIFFIIFFIISVWKIYAFLPNKQLKDDDTTKSSQDELTNIVLKVIKNNHGDLTKEELFHKVKDDSLFDHQHFWRFNQNKLNQLLNHYYLENPDTKSIKDIYKNL